jgi:HlyD family secretion protein
MTAARVGALILILLAFVAGWIGSPRLPPSPLSAQGPTADAPAPTALASERDTIATLGRLIPQGGILNIAPTSGRIARILVKEGQVVEGGQALAYLEQHAVVEAQLGHAKAKLAEAKKRLEAETRVGNALIRQAKADKSRLALKELELKRSESDRKAAKLKLASAKDDLADEQALAEAKVGRRANVRKFAQAKELAEETLARAEMGVQLVKAQLEQDTAVAETALAIAEANLALALAAVPLSSLQGQIELLQRRLDRYVVRSPHAGQILKILAQPGELVGQRPLLKLGNTQTMYVVAEVYQTDIRFLAVGQRATVTSGALPEKLTGVVENVGLMIFKSDVFGDDPTAALNARVFQVLIRLDPSEFAGRFNNLEASVTIDVRKAANADGTAPTTSASSGE